MADHIQIPQVWMRNFMHKSSEGEKVYCYLCQIGTISEEKISDLGAEDNYYIPDFEKYLSKNWEMKFGEINKKIRKGIKTGVFRFELTENECDFLKRFLTLSIGRSKTFQVNLLQQHNSIFPFIGIREIAPLSVVSEKPMFNDYNIQFLFNRTNVGFVLPSYSYYYIHQQNFDSPIMVLTDKIAIRFVKKEKSIDFNKMVNCSVLMLDNEENIKNYNYYAAIAELGTNNDFIISKNKKDLEILINSG